MQPRQTSCLAYYHVKAEAWLLAFCSCPFLLPLLLLQWWDLTCLLGLGVWLCYIHPSILSSHSKIKIFFITQLPLMLCPLSLQGGRIVIFKTRKAFIEAASWFVNREGGFSIWNTLLWYSSASYRQTESSPSRDCSCAFRNKAMIPVCREVSFHGEYHVKWGCLKLKGKQNSVSRNWCWWQIGKSNHFFSCERLAFLLSCPIFSLSHTRSGDETGKVAAKQLSLVFLLLCLLCGIQPCTVGIFYYMLLFYFSLL